MIKLKEIFKNIDWCKIGIHNYEVNCFITGTGWEVRNKYCKRCGKFVREI